MKHRNAVKRLLNLGLISLLAVSSHAFAGAFQLFEYNGVNAGDAGAGGAAIAEDASTGFINPAGLTRLQNKQVVLSGAFINARSTFEGTTQLNTNTPVSGASRGNDSAIIPAFHFAAPINQNLVFGVGLSAPFGLGTRYGNNAFTRYVATTTNIEVLDLAPSLGFKVTDKLSLGIGADIEKVSAELESIAGNGNTAYDSLSHTEASDWGYGYHAGALYEFTPATRVGLSYRSQVVVHPSGLSVLTGRLGGPYPYLTNGTLTSIGKTDLKLPPMTTLSLYHDVNQRLALMGTINYTQWSTLGDVVLRNLQGAQSPDNPSGILPPATLPLNFKNSWRVAIGSNYKLTQAVMLRGGVAFDQTPSNARDRSIRLPDANRTLVSIGSRYKITKMVALDLGYTHIFMNKANIDYTTTVGRTSNYIYGVSRTAADELGAQITWNLG